MRYQLDNIPTNATSDPTGKEPRVYKDKLKKDKTAQLERDKLLTNCNNVITTILKQPLLWGLPQFSKIRENISKIASNSVEFPLQAAPSIVLTVDKDLGLASDFITRIFTGEILKEADMIEDIGCTMELPNVIVTNIEDKYRSYECSVIKQKIVSKQVTPTSNINSDLMYVPLFI